MCKLKIHSPLTLFIIALFMTASYLALGYVWASPTLTPLSGGVAMCTGTINSGTSVDMSSCTDSIIPPSGTTAQRPSPAFQGMQRFNTDTKTVEYYNGTVWVNSGPPSSASATHSIVTTTSSTGFQVSATRPSVVSYSPVTSTTATIGGASSVTVSLEIAATNSTTPSDWTEIARFTNTQTITLAVILQSVQGAGAPLVGVVPAGYFARLRSATTGTSSASYAVGQETLL